MATIRREGLGPDNQKQGNGAIVVGAYRYRLWRTWDEARPRLLWVLLNPSIADGQTDDPTLRRCIGFSRAWLFGGLEIVNLFALRATNPREIYLSPDPVGLENDRYLAEAAARATRIIVAWGERGGYLQRDRAALALLSRYAGESPYCLGTARNGCPRHPLYLASSTASVPYHAESAHGLPYRR